MLITNIYNEDIHKDELWIYKRIKENKKEKIVEHFSLINEENILSLKELNNGYLLIVQNNNFKINRISKSENSIKEIQNKKLENDEHFKDIIELINGYLISISYSEIDNSKNKIIIWNKNLMSGNYEIYKIISIKDKPMSLLEINKNHFVIFSEEQNLFAYYSKSGEEYQKINIKSKFPFIKMIKVIEDGILFLYEKYLILFCLSSLQIKKSLIEDFITNICYIDNSNNYFLASFSNQDNNGIFLLNIDLTKYIIFKTKIIINNAHSMRINYISQLNNANIITGDDETIKIWVTR